MEITLMHRDLVVLGRKLIWRKSCWSLVVIKKLCCKAQEHPFAVSHMNLTLQSFGICSIEIRRIKPFNTINSARISFHSLFHVALSLPWRCHSTLSFQVFRFSSSGVCQRDYLSLPSSHLPKFIISTPCLMVRLTFHVNWRTFPWLGVCGSAVRSWAVEEPLQENSLSVLRCSYPSLEQI